MQGVGTVGAGMAGTPAYDALAASGGPLPSVEVGSNCPGCGLTLDPVELAAGLYVCECGHHFQLHAEAWVALLADPGSWQEHWAGLEPTDFLHWELPKRYSSVLEEAAQAGLHEAVRTGTCSIGGRPAWLGVFDFRFVGGTLSVVAGERLLRGMERARHDRRPYILVTASGGARMQEGVLALMQMAKVNVAVAELEFSQVPYFSILTHPTYGGTAASLALLADVNLAEPEAAIGFTGPRVIKQATHEELPEGFQSAEFQLQHGQIDMVVPRTALRRHLAHLMDLYE